MDLAIAEALGAQLSGLQLRLDGLQSLSDLQDGDVRFILLSHPRGKTPSGIVYMPKMTLTEINRIEDDRERLGSILLLGRRINERSADQFRALGIQYLDSVGNAYLDFEGVHIDVRGRSTAALDGEPMRKGAVNLFSPRRAQVIFALLSWPELVGAPLRVLSHVSDVSMGQAHETVKLLEQTGYLIGGRLRRGNELLERWVAAYPTGLGAPKGAQQFRGDVDEVEAVEGRAIYISGEAAAREFIRPLTATIYVEKVSAELIIANRWRTDGDPNIFVHRAFWRAPDQPGERNVAIVREAPPILIYADLMASGESRQREAAREILKHHAVIQQL